MKGKISTGNGAQGLKPVYVHRQSRTLSKILAELLRASNSYVANQVFLEIGGHRLGGPVSLKTSIQVANEMLAAHGLAAAIHLEEGSGISLNNRFAARGLAKVLNSSRPTPTCSTAMTAAGTKPAAWRSSARSRAMPTPQATAVCFVISLASNDDEMRFRLLRAIESGL